MYHLVYISSADQSLEQATLQRILEKSVKKNAELGITGVLLYNGLNFLQVLEGPEEAVKAQYAQIVDDSNHHGIITILAESITRRSFSDWSMRLKIVPCEATSIPSWAPVHDDLISNLPDTLADNVLIILKSFNTLRG